MNDLTLPDLFMIWGFVAIYLAVLALIQWPLGVSRSKLALLLVGGAILVWPLSLVFVVSIFLIDFVRFLVNVIRRPH